MKISKSIKDFFKSMTLGKAIKIALSGLFLTSFILMAIEIKDIRYDFENRKRFDIFDEVGIKMNIRDEFNSATVKFEESCSYRIDETFFVSAVVNKDSKGYEISGWIINTDSVDYTEARFSVELIDEKMEREFMIKKIPSGTSKRFNVYFSGLSTKPTKAKFSVVNWHMRFW